MNRWHPAPRGLITAAAIQTWSLDRPAPEIVVYLWIWSQYEDGERPTRRMIARDFGWSEYYAKLMIRRVKEEHAAWVKAFGSDFSPKSKPAYRPPEGSYSKHLGQRFTQDSPDINRGSTDRAGDTTKHLHNKTPLEGEEIEQWLVLK